MWQDKTMRQDRMRSQALPCEQAAENGAIRARLGRGAKSESGFNGSRVQQLRPGVGGVAMKMGKWARLLLLAAPLVAGCKDFWQAPSSSSSTTTTTTLSSGYFYVLDSATSQVIAYDIVSGTLTEVASYALPSTPLAIAVAPNNEFLYVSTLNGIYLYTISSGTLSLYSSTPITTDPATSMQVDSTDTWLVEASGSSYLYAIPIVKSSGILNTSYSTCSVPLTGGTVNQLAIAPDNEYIFVAGGTSGTAAFAFTAGNTDPFGSAAYKTVAVETSSAGAALSVAVDPSNRLLYIGETDAVSGSGGLRAFTIGSSGALTEITSSPFASGGTGPRAILPKSTGDYVYVANWSGSSTGNISGFDVAASGSSYSLTKLSTSVATGIEPMGLVEDSSKQFVLAVSEGGSPYLDAYFFDTSTAGQLDTTITSSTFATMGIGTQH
jgi:6-phosphogluconolactonase (cycloisomerase 2 family)